MRPYVSAPLEVESNMRSFTKRNLTAIVFAGALCLPSIPAFSNPAPSTPTLLRGTAPSIRRGDLVRLRSGGPLMTVENIKGSGVDCYWSDGNGQPNAQTFPIEVLQKF
jgi:uncharacterized protein YodC (DUF2158 family)